MIVAAGDKVFHCCWKSARSIASVTGYKDPVTMTYTAHKGITTYVSCLSESDIFASSGIDGEIHVHQFQMVVSQFQLITNI